MSPDNKAFQQYDWVHLYNRYLHFVNSKSIVLEIGSSNAEKTIPLAQKCGQLIGIEKFKSRVINFGEDNIKIIECAWEKLDKSFPKNHFDIVVASHVIEHVEDDLGDINQIHHVLKPGGVALLTTPNRTRLSRFIIELFTGPRVFPWWEHVREYDYQTLNHLLESSKFSTFKITPVVFGIHSGSVKFFLKNVPLILRHFTNYWEIELHK